MSGTPNPALNSRAKFISPLRGGITRTLQLITRTLQLITRTLQLITRTLQLITRTLQLIACA